MQVSRFCPRIKEVAAAKRGHLFRFTVKSTRKALGHHDNACSLREAERLKTNPVSGVISWYDVKHDELGNSLWASNVYLLAPKSGQQVTLKVPPSYPHKPLKLVDVPLDLNVKLNFKPGKTLREYAKEVVLQMDAHCQVTDKVADVMREKHEVDLKSGLNK